MFKDVKNPKSDEALKFAFTIIASVFLIITIAISYEITQWI
ncbi:MAG: hypothetical protein Q8L11_00830 [Candidatus Moranbacteria bacterium]|nr:hypothetical protein [bacterium]MDP1833464.1 hypothetical protein [Candidatus Moranbacteria bacterium]MDP1884406.1 hypothetical protein [Candidatus Moranbacteria bacterium]